MKYKYWLNIQNINKEKLLLLFALHWKYLQQNANIQSLIITLAYVPLPQALFLENIKFYHNIIYINIYNVKMLTIFLSVQHLT